MNITSSTKIMAVLGHPIEHSLSPAIHNFLLEKYNINCVYTAFDITEESLEKAVGFLRSVRCPGFNVTMPHKQTIIKYLDGLSKEAQLIGAVNTVALQEGKLIGYNTDARGFTQSIKEKNIEIKGSSILFFGSGGAARAASFQCAIEGAREIVIVNRDEVKAKELAQEMLQNFKGLDVKAKGLGEFIKEKRSIKYDIVVNSTSLGMYPNIDSSIIEDRDLFISNKAAFDMVYNPKYTKFLTLAKQSNMTIIPGIDMLLNQGILAFKLWFGIEDDTKDIKTLLQNQNLIILH